MLSSLTFLHCIIYFFYVLKLSRRFYLACDIEVPLFTPALDEKLTRYKVYNNLVVNKYYFYGKLPLPILRPLSSPEMKFISDPCLQF